MSEKYPLALAEGTILAGQYIIDKALGQGGFGITYMATDHNTGGKVAVKEFFPDSMATRNQTTVVPFTGERSENFTYGKTCFLQEAETLAQFIGVENIVKIHSYFEENGTAYFVMDFVEGISFDQYIKDNGGKVSYQVAEDILIKIIDALAVVHSKGIVHRDVTPDNIYITNDGTVKLLDFGAARYSIGDKSRSLDVVLKHGFAPKEQYTRHGKQGPFTDVYTVGASFYFAITGKRPPDSIDRIEEDDLVPPSSLGVDIPANKEDAILKAMSVQPGERFQTMDAFRQALMGTANAAVAGQSAVINQKIFTAPTQPGQGYARTSQMPQTGYPQPAGHTARTGGQQIMGKVMPAVEKVKIVAQNGVKNASIEQKEHPKKKKWLKPAVIGAAVLAAFAILMFIGGGGETQNAYEAIASVGMTTANSNRASKSNKATKRGSFDTAVMNNLSNCGIMYSNKDGIWYGDFGEGLKFWSKKDNKTTVLVEDISNDIVNNINVVDENCIVYVVGGGAYVCEIDGSDKQRIQALSDYYVDRLYANSYGAFFTYEEDGVYKLSYINWAEGKVAGTVSIDYSNEVAVSGEELYYVSDNGNDIYKIAIEDFGTGTSGEKLCDLGQQHIYGSLVGDGKYLYAISAIPGEATIAYLNRINTDNGKVDSREWHLKYYNYVNLNICDGMLYISDATDAGGQNESVIWKVKLSSSPEDWDGEIMLDCEPFTAHNLCISSEYDELWVYGFDSNSYPVNSYMDIDGSSITEYLNDF